MCRISRDTVKRASEKTMNSCVLPSRKSKGAISLSLNYKGGSYRSSVSMAQVKEAYGRAVAIVDKK